MPQHMSMVCGRVLVHLTEPVAAERMPMLHLTFFCLTIDNDTTGHTVWPTEFEPAAKVALRMQAQALLKQVIDDPDNPTDSTMTPALTGRGESVWRASTQAEACAHGAIVGRRLAGRLCGRTGQRRRRRRRWSRSWSRSML